jgi:hypothetical protein
MTLSKNSLVKAKPCQLMMDEEQKMELWLKHFQEMLMNSDSMESDFDEQTNLCNISHSLFLKFGQKYNDRHIVLSKTNQVNQVSKIW